MKFSEWFPTFEKDIKKLDDEIQRQEADLYFEIFDVFDPRQEIGHA